MSQYFDVIFVLLLALFIVLRLRLALGERNRADEERAQKHLKETRRIAEELSKETPEAAAPRDSLPPDAVISMPERDLQKTLEQIRRYDKGISLRFLFEGIREVFRIVTDAFAQAKEEELSELMTPELYKEFAQTLRLRKEKNLTMRTEIVRIVKLDLQQLLFEEAPSSCQADVLIEAQMISYFENAEGAVVKGDNNKVETKRARWTFIRNFSEEDPVWYLAATEPLEAAEK